MENGDGTVLEKITSKVDQAVGLSGGRGPDNFGSSLGTLVTQSKKTESLADKENGQIIVLRRIWSFVILGLIVVIVLFDIVLVRMYGIGAWTFDNPKVVITVITENFLKVVGLGYVITKALFEKIFDMNKNSPRDGL